MDAIQQTILIPSQPSFSTSSPHQLVHFTNSHKSSDVEKQALIAKIRHVHNKNAELEAKQQSLQNTLNDLRKLLQSTASENQQYIKQIEEENEKLGEKAARLAAGLRQAHRQGKHLDNCSLFWRAFVE